MPNEPVHKGSDAFPRIPQSLDITANLTVRWMVRGNQISDARWHSAYKMTREEVRGAILKERERVYTGAMERVKNLEQALVALAGEGES